MPSESGERRPARSCDHLGLQPPPVAENLQCPRCESTNTKFCYYNNYNMSQPRYFCKSCRRYWTQGGTLRNIPVGGGTRKHAKRSRTSSSASSATSSSSCSSLTTHDHEAAAVPVSFVKPDQVDSLMMMKNGVNLNENNAAASGGFSALLNSRGPAGFLALGGYGMGVGPMFDEMGYGLTTRGVGVWTFPHEVGGALGGNHGGGVVGCVGVGGGGGGDSSVASSGRNPFPMSGNDGGGWPDVDCFGWPDLAISMPGNALK